MDAESLLKNSGNINLLSSTLLQPYQMAIIQGLIRTSLKFDLTTEWVGFEQATKILAGTDTKNSDALSDKIDSFLTKNKHK